MAKRKLLQISLKPDLYEQIRAHCNQLDMPMAIWARELINRELKQELSSQMIVPVELEVVASLLKTP
jgi:hypothetical protein